MERQGVSLQTNLCGRMDVESGVILGDNQTVCCRCSFHSAGGLKGGANTVLFDELATFIHQQIELLEVLERGVQRPACIRVRTVGWT